MSKFETQTSQLSLIDGVRKSDSPCIVVAAPRTIFSTQARKGRLYLIMEGETGQIHDHDACQLVARTLRKAFYDDSSFSITASLKAAIRAANKALYHHNFNFATQKRTHMGLTCAVIKDGDLFIAQVTPSQAYIVTSGQVRALPTPPAWHSAHISASPFLSGNALGSSLFIDPELYRCQVRPGDTIALCSSVMTRLLGQAAVEEMLDQEDAAASVEQFQALCLEHDIPSAYVLTISLHLPRRTTPQDGLPRSASANGWQATAIRRVFGSWFARLRGREPFAPPGQATASASQMREDAAASSPTHTPDAPGQPGPADPLTTMPETPSHSPRPLPRPRPMDTGPGLDELHRSARLTRRPTGQPGKRRRSIRVSALVDESNPPFEEMSVHRHEAIDLSYWHDVDAQRVAKPSPYQPRHKRRPLADMSWYERLLVPFRSLGAAFARSPDRPKRSGMKLESLPPARGEGLSYLRRGPAFPLMTFLVLGLSVVVLILYGLNLSSQSARERADEDLNLAEQRITAIWDAPDHDTALDRLENARQAIDQIRNSALITETNAALWLRYQELQSDYEDAVSSIQRLTFFKTPELLAQHPVPTGRFASVVVPPATSSVTDTHALEALQFIYALDADRENTILYRLPRDGGAVESYLSSNQPVQNTQVQALRAIAWRVDNIVAIDQGPNASGYYFRKGAEWNHSRLGGSELWLPGTRLDMATYQGNLYVWGAEPGEILRFTSGHYGDPPMLWIDPTGMETYDLSVAVDMEVDGQIYLLQPDGTILVLNGGRFEREIVPEEITPPINTPTRFFVTGAPNEGSIFLLEPLNKRIIQIEKSSGNVVQQMMAHPDASVNLDQLTDLYVDISGVRPELYLVNGNQIVRVELPNPPTPFTPSASTAAPGETAP